MTFTSLHNSSTQSTTHHARPPQGHYDVLAPQGHCGVLAGHTGTAGTTFTSLRNSFCHTYPHHAIHECCKDAARSIASTHTRLHTHFRNGLHSTPCSARTSMHDSFARMQLTALTKLNMLNTVRSRTPTHKATKHIY